MTDTAYARFVKSGTTVGVCVSNLIAYHEAHLFTKTKDIEDQELP